MYRGGARPGQKTAQSPAVAEYPDGFVGLSGYRCFALRCVEGRVMSDAAR
jgi:hypothetical protein